MYLKQIPNKKSGRTFLMIVKPYYHKESGNTRTKTILSLGYLDELEKKMEDPITYYKALAKKMKEEDTNNQAPISITCDLTKTINTTQTQRKNLGYAAFSKIYHDLKIHQFMVNRQRSLKIDYQLNQVFKMLIFQRLLNPSSKKNTFEQKDHYFEKYDFNLADVYRSLSVFTKHKDTLLKSLHKSITNLYGRDTSNVFYDVTNYYFEIDQPDDLRKKGVSKEHRPNPIVQMGLLMDNNGLPMSYKLFSGNTNDCNTLLPILSEIKREYDVGRVVVVADKGLNTSENVGFNLIKGDGYVYSQTIRGATQAMKSYVLDQEGYKSFYKDSKLKFKIKSRQSPRTIKVTNVKNELVNVDIDEKQVIFYSEKYAQKARADREPALKKAQELVDNPGQFNKANSYGAKKYIKNLTFDPKTGEILTVKNRPTLDLEKIKEEEKYDGYYAIITSESNWEDEKIVDTYRGLWKIEESFRVTKSDLKTRPIFVSRHDRIEAHFLTCFVSLLLLRILQLQTKNKFSATRIIESLSRYSGSLVESNIYLFDYFDDVLKEIGHAVNIDFNVKFRELNTIKKVLSSTKKVRTVHNFL